ncbi:MAG: energy transducer TonB [Calditrichia bacterium]|nr:energy transducer TonB [Calditrichia bacterium]
MAKLLKTILYFCLSIFLFIFFINQIQASEIEKSEFYLFVDEMPKFGKTEQDLYKYLYSNVKWPKIFGGSGEVLVSLIINKKGFVEDVKIEKELFKLCADEVKRVLLGMPAWEPGKKNNIPVNVKIYLPFRFVLK